MSRYTGPSWKISRRLGISLSGTGKELARRPYAPGQHGPSSRGARSEYGQQMAEKQKLRHMYGMNERQFRNLFVKASKIREGKHGVNFMILLEQRLDNVVYRLGLATTRRQARQLVNHGHILVDGKRVDIPSYHVEVGQQKTLRFSIKFTKSHSFFTGWLFCFKKIGIDKQTSPKDPFVYSLIFRLNLHIRYLPLLPYKQDG